VHKSPKTTPERGIHNREEVRKMMLDATAGNRMLWHNKSPPNTVFLDRETRLRVPPDVFGCWKKLPFRDDVFDVVLFDPPHHRLFGPKSLHKIPQSDSWFGEYLNRKDFIRDVANAVKEFRRVGKRLCFKWCESSWEYLEKTTGRWRRRNENPTLWQMLTLFHGWKEINRLSRKSTYGKSPQTTHWVTFIASGKFLL